MAAPPLPARHCFPRPHWALFLIAILAVIPLPASALGGSGGPLVLSAGWQFALDPDGIGLGAGWQLPAMPFPVQRLIRTGESLADQGIPEFRGYSWYRQAVQIPDGWQRVVLGFGALDVAAQVFVNGV